MLWEADLCFGKLIFVFGNCYVFWEIDSYSKWFEPGVTCNIVV